MKYKRVLLKISGESLKQEDETILDSNFITSVAKQIKTLIEDGVEVGVVIGGGNIWRGKVAEELNMKRETADWMGMLATIINSLSLKAVLEDIGQTTIVMNSFDVQNCGELLDVAKAKKVLAQKTVVIFGGGTGRTHFSTDTAASMRAKDIQAEAIIMGKNNADGVFDKDPNKNKDAKVFETITYSDIIEKQLEVIDQKAVEILQETNIEMIVFDVNKKDSIVKTLNGENQKYTTIKNKD